MPGKPPLPSKKRIPKPSSTAPKRPEARPAKTFAIDTLASRVHGEKIVVYGPSGIGKTSLAALAPNPVFFDIDGSLSHLTDADGNPIPLVTGVESFQDIRDALNQTSLWPEKCTIVIDTLTKVEELQREHVMETITVKGQRVTSFRKYGWDGDRYLLESGQLLLSDLDRHIRAGRNVLLLCQLAHGTVANVQGSDYLCEEPMLQHRKDCSFRDTVKQWADHVFRISYIDLQVDVEGDRRVGKAHDGGTERAVFTGGAPYYSAKTRPMNGTRLPDVISFESEADGSLYDFMFGGDE
jgi:hypothetical protein